jgi:hypothetical protein
MACCAHRTGTVNNCVVSHDVWHIEAGDRWLLAGIVMWVWGCDGVNH